MKNFLANKITIFLIFSMQKVYLLVVVKSRHLKYKFLINRSLLLVKYWKIQKYKYLTFLKSCWLLFFLAIFALLNLKVSKSELLLLSFFAKITILIQFYFIFCCLELDDLFDLLFLV